MVKFIKQRYWNDASTVRRYFRTQLHDEVSTVQYRAHESEVCNQNSRDEDVYLVVGAVGDCQRGYTGVNRWENL